MKRMPLIRLQFVCTALRTHGIRRSHVNMKHIDIQADGALIAGGI